MGIIIIIIIITIIAIWSVICRSRVSQRSECTSVHVETSSVYNNLYSSNKWQT